MPKLIGPLFSASASGAFAGLIEYRRVNGQAVATKIRTITKPRTQAQKERSARFSEAAAAWSALDYSQANAWKSAAQVHDTNGYRLYLREYLAQGIVAPAQPVIPA